MTRQEKRRRAECRPAQFGGFARDQDAVMAGVLQQALDQLGGCPAYSNEAGDQFIMLASTGKFHDCRFVDPRHAFCR